MLFFKTVGSRDAVTKATWMYSRDVLRGSMEATCGLYRAMLNFALLTNSVFLSLLVQSLFFKLIAVLWF